MVALQAHQAVALIHATDGAADGIRKLDAILKQKAGKAAESPEFPVIGVLTSEQLDLALGRSNVIHAALLAGSAGKTFLYAARFWSDTGWPTTTGLPAVWPRITDDDSDVLIRSVRTRTTATRLGLLNG